MGKVVAFIKQNWQALLLFVAAGAIMCLLQALDNANDEHIAQLMADKVVAKERERFQKGQAVFRAQLAAKEALIMSKDGALEDAMAAGDESARLAAERLVEIRKIRDCEKRASAMDLELANRAAVEADFRLSLRMSVAELVLAYNGKIDLQATRIRELEEQINGKGGLIERLGSATKRIVQLELRARRKLVVGPQAGYNPLTKETYIGFGATVEVWRLKFPWPG